MYINPEASSLVEYSMSIKSGRNTHQFYENPTLLLIYFAWVNLELRTVLRRKISISTCRAEPVQTSVETLRQMFGPNWFYVHSLPYLLISFVKFITILAYIFPKFCFFYKYIQTCMNTQSVLFTIFIWHVTLIEWFSLYIQNVNGVKTPSLFIDFAIAV